MKRVWLMGAILLLWVAEISWATTEEELDRVRLQLKWRHQFQFAGYYAAIEKGYYEEVGLDVELLEAEVGQNAFDVVLAGGAEFGVSNSEIVQRCAEGDPVVQLAVVYQHSPLVLLSLRTHGIETLHDLVGNILMIEPNSAELLALFAAEGIDLNQIKQVPHNFSVSALMAEEVQAISAYYSDEPFAVMQHNFEPVVFTPRAAGIDFYGDGIFTTREQVENYPRRVEAFRRASIRGWEYALAHPTEMIDLILSKYSQRKSREQLEYEAMKTGQLVRADLVPVGYMNPGRWDYIADIFYEVGLTERRVDPASFLFQEDSPFLWRKFLILIFGLAGLCIVVMGIAWYLFRSKIRLEAAIRRKQEVEGELRRSEAFYRNFYESAPLPFLYWDRDCRIRHWNPAAERVFGWKAEEVIGRRFVDFLIPDDQKEEVLRNVDEIVRKEVSHPIHWNLRKDGTRIWCHWHNVALFDEAGEFVECQSIAIDATRQQEREQFLLTEKELAELASENKGQFLASVSHEIRNPLSAIISLATFIREDSKEGEKREMADTIVSSGESLIRILNDLIDHEKLEVGVIELVPSRVCVADSVRKTTKLYQKMAADKGVELLFETNAPEAEATLDTLRIQQIVTNLLSNSLKFTSEGAVTVSVNFNRENLLPVEIRVEDTGIGMTPEEADGIFQLYHQGKQARCRTYGGTGVGLSVCEKLVKLMGGRIEVSSEPNVGSVFRVFLPEEMETRVENR